VRVEEHVRERMAEWKASYEGVEELKLAVMGCVVNGPGESKAAHVGISLPGTGEAPTCPVFVDGLKFATLSGSYDELARRFLAIVDDYVATRFRRRDEKMGGTAAVDKVEAAPSAT
jgi:(E)-4-hydroxy-3-methylbut-2-enyl-diphosphate synthase